MRIVINNNTVCKKKHDKIMLNYNTIVINNNNNCNKS